MALSFRSVRPCYLDPVCLSRALPQEVLHLMTEKRENRKWSRFASGLHTYPTHQRIFDWQGDVRRAEGDLAMDIGQPASKPFLLPS